MHLRKLTDEQLEAVMCQDNLFLTACPGSGKTRTLVSKIANDLLTVDLGKKYILAITYTNIASETILERLNDFGINKANLWVGTIHSFCLEWVIKPYASHCKLVSKGFRVIDEYEQRDIIETIKKQFEIDSNTDVPTFLNTIGIINPELPVKSQNAVMAYHDFLEENKLIDFDLILTISLYILNSYQNSSKRLAKLFYSLLIDEFQDTRQIQYEILGKIYQHKMTKVVIVGDPDQAIFSSLGSVVKSSNQLCEAFGLEKIKELSLTGCFRSTTAIIDFFSKFQQQPYKINSLYEFANYPSVIDINFEVQRDQLPNYIAALINKHLSEGVSLNEIVVLAPRWWDVITIGRKLSHLLPAISFNAPSLSPIPYFSDNVWFKLVKLYCTEISAKTYTRRKRLGENFIYDLMKLNLIYDDTEINSRKLLKVMNQIKIENTTTEEFVTKLVTIVLNEFKLDISQSLSAQEQFISISEAITKRVAQEGIDDNSENLHKFFNSTNGLKITTCHSVKGEEYDVVICTGLLKGLIPFWSDIIGCTQEHSDYVANRLLYVICSRAKRNLYLISEIGHVTRKGDKYIPTQQLAKIL